jgi:hypothetical protein
MRHHAICAQDNGRARSPRRGFFGLSLGTSEKLTSVYLCVLCGEIFIKKFTTEDTKVHRGVLGLEFFQSFPSSELF